MAESIVTNLEQRIKNNMDSFMLGSSWVNDSDAIRLDASYYNNVAVKTFEKLEKSNLNLEKLGNVVDRVFMPPQRLKRTYVEDINYGIPFLQGSHIVHFKPPDMKYVSKTKQAQIDKLIIKAGWILLTRSGSTGRATIALENWDGWAASEHIFRILPNEDKCLSGYLYAFLSSDLGQAQLQRSIYGAVVDELTEDHIREITVPIPTTAKHIEITKKIDEMAKTVCRLKYHAITLDDDAINSVSTLFDDDYNPNHLEDFNEVLRRAVTPAKPRQT